MARDNFARSLSAVLKHEGGYVDHPRDPGGATNLGVTIGTLSNWFGRPATKAEVKALTISSVGPIYRAKYWNAIKGDELPGGLDYAVFDFSVNSGPSRAARYLQEVLGVRADGKIGPVTLKAARDADVSKVINALCDRRMTFLRGLSTFDAFGKGWTSRVSGVRTMALQMAGTVTINPTPAKPTKQPPMAPGGGAIAVVIAIATILGAILGKIKGLF